jgi:SpoVK/Ycf46/Vps4 family AAA+-type ATPase
MLFLTTNQGDAIDPAFQSRIHLTLHYPDLNAEARKRIWTSFAARSEMSDLSEDDFIRLSELSLNGREIKNVVQIACLLARREDSRLEARHVQVVLDATKPTQS